MASREGTPARALALIVLIAAFYGPAITRSFTSEDFLLLRLLGGRPPWQDLAGTFGGPWLGLTIVKFYRPVATTLLALERAWFGVQPLPYHLVHVGVHAANALLVVALARRVQRRFVPGSADGWMPWLAALPFAVYPLHPNAVLWVASFATPFGACFVLASAVLYCRHRDTKGAWPLVAALGAFALALGSYESAVVLPALLVALEVLAPRDPRGAVVALAPFAALAAGYLALRLAIFGVVIGGYEDVAARLTAWSLATHADNVVTSVHRLLLPVFDAPPSRAASLAVLAVVVLAPAALALVSRGRAASGYPRLVLFAAAWVLVSMAPFAFVPVVPASGRYWYTATAGAGLGLAALGRWLGAAFPRLRLAGLAVPLAVTIGWGWLLSGHVALHREAARTARAIQAAVAEVAAGDGATRRFVTGYPLFLRNQAGVNLAQVFHYGLADALAPPFRPEPAVHVYPLPPLAPAALAPLARLPGARVYAWTEARLLPLPVPIVSRTLAATGPADGAVVEVPSERGQRLRLIVLAAGNWNVVEVPAAGGAATPLTLPRPFVGAMSRLYPGREILWWAVAEDAAGRVVAASEVRPLVLPSEQVAVALGVVEPLPERLLGIPPKGNGHQ